MKTQRLMMALLVLLLGAASLPIQAKRNHDHDEKPSDRAQELTVGLVQKEIRQGMSGAEVAEALGSPNIVTRDSEGKEVWIYDKIASEARYERKERGFWGTILILGGTASSERARSVSTQKTLTVIIHFNQKQKVDSFSYHSSKF